MSSEQNDGFVTPSAYGTELGHRIKVFRPWKANIVAGYAFSVIMVVAGAALVGFPPLAPDHWNLSLDVEKGWYWLAVGSFSLIGLGLVIGGVILAVYSRRLASSWVEVCTHGFRNCRGATDVSVRWTDISRIKETIRYDYDTALGKKLRTKIRLPTVTNCIRSYRIMTKEGEEFCFNGNSIKGIKRFAELLREHANRLSLLWETVEKRHWSNPFGFGFPKASDTIHSVSDRVSDF